MIIPIGGLRSISKGAKTWFGKLEVPDLLKSVQLSAILGTVMERVVSYLWGVPETQ